MTFWTAWDPKARRMVYLPPFRGGLVRFIERYGVRRLIESSKRRPVLKRYLEVLT